MRESGRDDKTSREHAPAIGSALDELIDRIVPRMEPVSEEYVAEYALWQDRSRIRRELVAALSSPAQVERESSREDLLAQVSRLRGALEEAIEFASADGMCLTPLGEAMVARWQQALSLTLDGGLGDEPSPSIDPANAQTGGEG